MRNILIFLLLACLGACHSYQLPIETEATLYRMDRTLDSTEGDSIQNLIAPYKEVLDREMNQIIGTASELMDKRRPESKLGNWVADAIQKQGAILSEHKIDFSIQNFGGIRVQDLAAGAIPLGKIYEIMPFDNTLVIVEMNGTVLRQLFNQLASTGGWPMSIEARYSIHKGKAIDITVNGSAVDPDQLYYIGIPDYVANGNDDCPFLVGLNREETGVLIRDLLIKEVKEQQEKGLPIQSEITGRVVNG